mmetsp:Transcript_6507/g.7784  ORF Transcript_6507/g.7784 Transcript_6507/m.7784 type:complete len:293 (+) Transcript_6507:1414-2292(+)
MVMMHGQEHHPAAHFEQGYWNLRDHQPHLGDEGHFAGEEHGEYHYIEPERTQHMGHYYNQEDEREHYPQHVDQHHNVHGIEHRPDDWKSDHHTIWNKDTYHYAPDHSFEGDFNLREHHGEPHNEHGQDYTHDVKYHDGHALMGQVEHEYDELFHELEHKTLHGVEHHDVHYPEMSLKDVDKDGHEGVTDFRAESTKDDHHTYEDQHYGGHQDTTYDHEGGWHGDLSHGTRHGYEGYHGDYSVAGQHGDYGHGAFDHGEYGHHYAGTHGEIRHPHVAPVQHEVAKGEKIVKNA